MNEHMSWIAAASYAAEWGLRLALQAGVLATLLAMAVLAINLLLRRWLSTAQMGTLWGLVLLRLLLPAAPGSAWSLQNLLVGDRVEGVHSIAIPRDVAVMMSRVNNSDLQEVSFGVPVIDEAAMERPSNFELSRVINALFDSLPIIWLLGAGGCLAWTVATHWRFARQVRRTPISDDRRLIDLWTQACQVAGVRRVPSLIEFSGAEQPAVTGLFRPLLLLPPEVAELDDEQLRMIMLHELAHIRRYDVAANWTLAAIRALHWWNPIYWLAAARFSSLREQACDAFVIERTEASRRRVYSDLLVTMAERQPAAWRWRVMLSAGMLGFLPSLFRSFGVRGRLVAIHSLRIRRSRWHAVAGCVLLLLTAASGLTDARSSAPQNVHNLRRNNNEPLTVAEWMSQPRVGRATDAPNKVDPTEAGLKRLHMGPVVKKTYDVARSLQRLAIEEPRFESTTLLGHLVSLVLNVPPQKSYASAPTTLPRLRDSSRGFSIDGSQLHFRAPAAMHDELAVALAAWNDVGIGQISIETRVIQSQRDVAAELGLVWQHFGATTREFNAVEELGSLEGKSIIRGSTAVEHHAPITMTTLNEAQTLAFMEAVQGDRRTNVWQHPKVTVFNGQTATLADCTKRPFVTGVYYIAGAPGYEGAHQPKIEVVKEGTKIRIRATQSVDLKHVDLTARIQSSVIEEVLTASTVHRGGTVTIENPRVQRRDVELDAEVPDGGSLLVGCLPTSDEEEFFYVLFTPTPLEGRTFRAAE